MPTKIELIPKAELGRGYALIDENRVEIHVGGVMGALKAWLIGKNNLAIGNIVGGRLVREVETEGYHSLLITQSGKQMFFGSWRTDGAEPEQAAVPHEEPRPEPSPLPDMEWERVTSRSYPEASDGVRLLLSNRAFFDAFKKYGYYLFGRCEDGFALAVRHGDGDSNPFPSRGDVEYAGEYVYVRIK